MPTLLYRVVLKKVATLVIMYVQSNPTEITAVLSCWEFTLGTSFSFIIPKWVLKFYLCHSVVVLPIPSIMALGHHPWSKHLDQKISKFLPILKYPVILLPPMFLYFFSWFLS